jgi:hypothetical protein
MKRLFLLLVLVMLVSWIMASHRSGRRMKVDNHEQTRRALAEARRALAEARNEVRQVLDEARDEVREAFGEARDSLVIDHHRSHGSKPVPALKAAASEHAEGLPVAIVPGTRVTEAQVSVPTAATRAIALASADPTLSTKPTVIGQLSATEERAKADARRKLRDEVAGWLDPDVPSHWAPPPQLFDSMVLETHIKPIHKDYGTLYEATLTVDKSPQRRTALIALYNRQVVERRLATGAGTLAFILICLAAVSGYIRADEATKGYYTNRLRMLAAAGVGAAGVVLYHMVA